MKPLLLPLLALGTAFASAQNAPFALHDGDRVVFYGDSITDQRLYTLFTEAYVRTHYPNLKVEFVHSGWGGDRVTGGGGGPIDARLARDVYPYRPTVVTIMLGMNDAGYRPFDQGIYDTYKTGYEHILSSLQSHAPGVRLTLIQPSPYDDVTRAPGFAGGYNAVLLRYSDLVRQEADTIHGTVADLNGPVVAMLAKANATDATNAAKIIPDRVHPGPAGHLVMAESLLRAWNASPVVSATTLDAATKKGTAQNTKLSEVRADGEGLAWTQQDDALPFPLDLGDGMTRLVVESSDFVSALDQQTVTVAGLDAGKRYDLGIDGAKVATFSGAELAAGVNLATLATPMQMQSRGVLDLIRRREEVHNLRWRNVQVPNEGLTVAKESLAKAEKGLDDYDRALDKAAMEAARPKAHRFTLMPAM